MGDKPCKSQLKGLLSLAGILLNRQEGRPGRVDLARKYRNQSQGQLIQRKLQESSFSIRLKTSNQEKSPHRFPSSSFGKDRKYTQHHS
jgi:hypothetical protein